MDDTEFVQAVAVPAADSDFIYEAGDTLGIRARVSSGTVPLTGTEIELEVRGVLMQPVHWDVERFAESGGGAVGSLIEIDANTVAMRNGTNAQEFQVFRDYVDSGNFERSVAAWEGTGEFKLGIESAGTENTNAPMVLDAGSTIDLQIDGTTEFQFSPNEFDISPDDTTSTIFGPNNARISMPSAATGYVTLSGGVGELRCIYTATTASASTKTRH